MASFKIARASYAAARGAAATISFALNVIETGAAENTAIGEFTVEGFPTFTVEITDTQGGQVKVSGQGLAVGATAPNAAIDPLLQPTGKIILPNGVERSWSLDLVVAGAVSGLTVTLAPHTKKFIATGSVLTAINAIADGNAVTIQHSTNSPIQVTYGDRYVTGAKVIPAPSASYTGVENTGWSSWTEDGNARTMAPQFSAAQGNGTGALGDETLTTAKPTLRMLTPQRQRFTGKIVLPFASDNEARVSAVRVYCEGSYVDITARSWFWDDGVTSGKEEWVYGWICELDAANYTGLSTDRLRGVQVLARAIPVDGTWQSRLIGYSTTLDYENFKFFPASALHDYYFEITPSAGADSIPAAAYPGVYGIFRTLEDAMRYAAGKTISGFTLATPAVAAHFRYTESVDANPANVIGFGTKSPYTSTRGYFKVDVATGATVTFGRAGPYDTTSTGGISGVPNNRWRTPVNPIWFKGVVFDHTYWTGFDYANGADGLAPSLQYPHVWEQVSTVCDWNMLTELDDFGGTRVGGSAAFTLNCTLKYCSGRSLMVSRNNVRDPASAGDLFTASRAVYGDRVTSADFSAIRAYRDAFTLQYTGGAGAPGLKKTTGSGSTSGVMQLLLDGVAIDAGFSVVSPARLADFVAWVNTHAGWTAVSLVTPNDRVTDRSPRYLCNSLTSGVTTVGDFKKVAFTMTWAGSLVTTHRTFVDVHGDMFAFPSGNGGDNPYFGFIQVWGTFSMQTVFFDGQTRSGIVENMWSYGDPGNANANYSTGPKNNLRIRAVSDPTIDGYLNDHNDSHWDIYSSMEDVTYNRILGETGQGGVRPVIANSHANTGPATNIATPVAMTYGGTTLTNYPGYATRDNRPGGDLLLAPNLIASPSTPFDAAGMVRLPNSPKGARGLGMVDGTYTKAQMLQLAAYCANNVTGTAVGTLSISGKAGAGETGSTVSAVISFDVA